jgi:hypothetical protein
MSIGGVLSEAWSVYQRFLGRFFMTALIVFVALDLLSRWPTAPPEITQARTSSGFSSAP